MSDKQDTASQLTVGRVTFNPTPGPWKADALGLGVRAVNEAMNICDVRGWGHLTGRGGLALPNGDAIEIQKANSRLIAAAPDLLNAAKETLAYWDSCGFSNCEPDCDCIVQGIQRAIAKAEGGAQ